MDAEDRLPGPLARLLLLTRSCARSTSTTSGSGSAFDFHRQLAQIGKPVDRTEWDMTPPTVNAYYDAQMNRSSFLPVSCSRHSSIPRPTDGAQLRRAWACVIGHEMTHGFDDQGRKFDARAISQTGGRSGRLQI